MNRIAWTLLILLVATNLGWWLSQEPAPESSLLLGEDTAALERQVDELEAELARHRRASPFLIGEGADPSVPAPAAAPPQPRTPATASAAAATGGPGAEQGDSDAAAAEAAAQKKAYEAARDKATAMLRKVMQVQDPALREEGLAELASALGSTDLPLVEYALSALYSLRALEIDTSRFRRLVADHLDSDVGGIRRSALYALAVVDPQQLDEARLLRSAQDPDPRVRSHVARLLAGQADKGLFGAGAEVTAALLQDEDGMVRKGTLRGLQGVALAPALERQLVAMAREGRDRHDAIYFGLSCLPQKSRPVVDALLFHLKDEDRQIRARAHWGLQRGIADDQKSYVARRYAERLGSFVAPQSQREALKLIARFGDDRLVPDLQRFADNELVDDQVRALAAKAAEHLASKNR